MLVSKEDGKTGPKNRRKWRHYKLENLDIQNRNKRKDGIKIPERYWGYLNLRINV